jgi:hypothetical protein
MRPAAHGTNARYASARWRCRCDACRAAHAAAARRRYDRQRADAGLLTMQRIGPSPERYRCPYCPGTSDRPEGHARCQPEHVRTIVPRVLAAIAEGR